VCPELLVLPGHLKLLADFIANVVVFGDAIAPIPLCSTNILVPEIPMPGSNQVWRRHHHFVIE
jgi:hypothetical protein